MVNKWLISIFVFLLIISCSKREVNNTITLESLLDEMISLEESAKLPFPIYTCLQESSYDRLSISPDSANWFANNDGFGIVRIDTIDGRIEKVMFDQKGPGVITRIWITTLDKRGIWRFYFDGADTANWIIPAYDLMKFGIPELGSGLLQAHTSYTPEGKGGNTLFLPLPYAKSCKISFEDEKGVEPTPKYYQINYRRYAKNIKVETFSKEVTTRATQKIIDTNGLLLNPPSLKQDLVLTADKALSPGDTLKISLPHGEKAVYDMQINIEINDTSDYAQTMRNLIIQAEFDDKQTVWVPLSDFSGGGMGAPYAKSWFLSANGKGAVTSRWLMPYKENGEIALINTSSSTIKVDLNVAVSSLPWNNRSLYFHSSWKQETDITLNGVNNKNFIDWNFATLKGKGVYKGDVLSLYNHSPAWYGEGDGKIWIDNDTFPSHFGTGTEDYYNSSWAPVVPFYTPFGGAPRADLESSHGYNTFFRTRNLDGIPFSEKLVFDIEMISWIDGSVDYATTVFWYGDYDSQAIGTSGIEEAKQKLPPVQEK